MASIVEFIIKMQDSISAPLANLSKNSAIANSNLKKLTDSNQKLRTMVTGSGRSVKDLGKEIERLQQKRDLLPASSETKIRAINSEMNKLKSVMGKMETMNGSKLKVWAKDAFSQLPGLVKNPLVAIGGALALSVNEGMKNAAEKLDFQLLIGDNAGAQLYSELNGLKKVFGTAVFGFGKELIQSGVGIEKITPLLNKLGDVAAGNKDKVGVLAGTFGELQKEGNLTESTLSALESNGFKPLDILSKTTGESMKSLYKRLDDGKITVDEVSNALDTATQKGGQFYGNMQRVSRLPTVKLEQLKQRFSEIAGRIGGVLLPIITKLVNALEAVFNWCDKNAGIIKILAGTLLGIVGIFKVYILSLKLMAMWQARDLIATKVLTIAKGGLAFVTGGLIGTFAILNSIMALNPLFIYIIAITALIATVIWLWKTFEGWGKFFQNLWTILKAVFTVWWINIKIGFENIMYYAELTRLKLKSFGQFVSGLFQNVGKALKLAADFKFAEAKAVLTTKIETGATAEIEALKKSHNSKQQGYDQEKKDAFKTIFETPLKGIITRKKEADASQSKNNLFGNKADYFKNRPKNEDKKTNENINAVSGGGVKNITVTIGKLIESQVNNFSNGIEAGAQDIGRLVEEALVRAIASGTGR